MTYDFRSLLPADFEDLARDLAGAALGVRFEAFAPGPDGGIDGRHAATGDTGDGEIILQAKHYVGSSFSALRTAMRRERRSIDRLAPPRYLLATSRPLTPANKATLGDVIGPALQSSGDILGPGDLNTLLRQHPEIERAHLKLWLSSASVLEAVVQAASHAFTATTRQEIAAKVRVYAQNPSLAEARNILDRRHVLIVSGPPGVGKTTLAEILAFAYLGEEWELVAIRSLEDGFARINDQRRQIFFFDDFLGSIALDHRALASSDSALALFMHRVRESPNARFILTTRAYILNEARSVSDRLADDRVDLTTYVLDMSSYTRAIRARILYNHLLVGCTPRTHILALLDSGRIAEIVDHPNYNPRVVEWMTDAVRLEDVTSDNYPEAFAEALANPTKLWDNAYRSHISAAARHLLIAIFFANGHFGVDIDTLRPTYEALHQALCRRFNIAQNPHDFEESLRRLEGSFLAIEDGSVNFLNPSLDDYLASQLEDGALLPLAAASVANGRAAANVWDFASELELPTAQRQTIALAFAPLIAPLTRAASDEDPLSGSGDDLSASERVKLLLDWWSATRDPRFVEGAIAVAQAGAGVFNSWRDGATMLDLLFKALASKYPEAPQTEALTEALDGALIGIIRRGIALDDLEHISSQVELEPGLFSEALVQTIAETIREEIESTWDSCRSFDSESELTDHAETLKQLAPRANVPEAELERALRKVEERIDQINDARPSSANEPRALPNAAEREPQFDDSALAALFEGLRE